MAKTIKYILKNEKKFTEVAKKAFDRVDTDHSGQIDGQELEKLICQIATDMGAELPSKEEVLQHLDADKSGKIDFSEFKILIRGVLEAMLEKYES